MITIYKNKNDIPQSMELIELNDYYFNKTTSQFIDDRAGKVIQIIDNAKLLGKYKIISGFNGVTLNIDKLSSGCKTALNILYFPDKVFGIQECGDNALDVVYSYEHGNVYCQYPMISFKIKQVMLADKNGKQQTDDYEKVKEWWDNV